MDPKILRLTAHDDEILKSFRADFPDLKVDVLNEEEMKSPEGKAVSRNNVAHSYFKKKIDYV